MKLNLLAIVCSLLPVFFASPLTAAPSFRVLALAEKGGIHKPFVDAAKVWLEAESERENFAIDYIEDTAKIDDSFLAHYQLFIQLNYPPYGWKPAAVSAFERYIEEGRGGWIGFHHATLLGEFDGFGIWPWFQNFMGGIRFTKYIPTFVSATVHVEAPGHPVMRNVDRSFEIKDEEWYTYDKSPRPNVHVLASVDENSYHPNSDIKMGDHPVVWTNNHVKARNVYIFMGHRPEHFHNRNFTMMFHNAILWASHKPRVLAIYSEKTEPDHVAFAKQAIDFFQSKAQRDGYEFISTTDWNQVLSESNCDAVLWLNDFPHTAAQRRAFEQYMENGGAWLGFHVAAYNDKDTHWPWFVDFLGGAVFYSNNWPPLPAKLDVDDNTTEPTHRLPKTFPAPANEWYAWNPNPRGNKNVKVLLTLDPANYPIGFKDVLAGGDIPVVWTNTRYRMLYINMGHGDKIFSNETQNEFFEDSLLSLVFR